ncbi:hypothetical protein EZV62_025614 [Acer yangbiense]|uniref:Uncharacterized protein n=1 Tax=Acer yangbiense TaxID=1000413 RepID=A0A5C7GYX6_9ROSI|nr:hypothetical protein EZV62_025614 [Acer yangbiense]
MCGGLVEGFVYYRERLKKYLHPCCHSLPSKFKFYHHEFTLRDKMLFASVADGFKCFLALEQLIVSFQEELRLSERRRADVEAQLKQMEHAMVHPSAEKRKTYRTHERNELKKLLAAKEKEVKAAVDKATNGGYFLASLHAAREAPTDFDLSQIQGWDREHILAIAEELKAKVAALAPVSTPADDIASSNGSLQRQG